jgi:hypothetical protein
MLVGTTYLPIVTVGAIYCTIPYAIPIVAVGTTYYTHYMVVGVPHTYTIPIVIVGTTYYCTLYYTHCYYRYHILYPL